MIKTVRHCSYFANIGKFDKIKKIDSLVIELKNAMSKFCFEHINELASSTSMKFGGKHYKLFTSKESPLSNWEIQQIFLDVATKYLIHVKKLFQNKRIQVQDKIKYSYYQRKTGNKLPGELKTKEITFRTVKTINSEGKLVTSTIVPILKYLVYLEDISQLKHEEIISNLNQFDYHKRQRIINLAILIRQNILKRIRLITFTTGTYQKFGYLESSKKNEVFLEDKTNTKYRLWYVYKTRNEVIYLPLQINRKYHSVFCRNKNHLVRVNKNKIEIFTTKEEKDPVFKAEIKAVGIDINVKHNMAALSNGDTIDYDRRYIKQIIEQLQKLDKKKKTEEQRLKTNKKVAKLCRRTEWYFKKKISEILDYFEENNITDVVMEDLSLSDKSYILNPEFNIKYSRLVRLLRLSNLNNWFRQQAEKRGIRLHTTPSHYTSQTCNICGCVDRENRTTQEEFKCINCHHKDNADLNAAKNILLRYSADVLRNNKSIHSFDKFGRMVAKQISYRGRATVKRAITESYTSIKNQVCIV